jgi:hypothetical protein
MNSVSEPPLNSVQPSKPVTFADVAMRLVQDGPIYAIIGLVGAMAVGGHATASEAVITGLAGLLARSWPRAVQVAGKAGVVLIAAASAFVVVSSVEACVLHNPVDVQPDYPPASPSARASDSGIQ